MVAKRKKTPRPARKAKRTVSRPASKVATTAKRDTITVSEARDNLSVAVSRVVYLGERVGLTKHGKVIAALVSAQDAALLDALEDMGDPDAARKALREAKRTGTFPWKKVKADR